MTAEQGSPTTNTSGDGRPAQSGDARGNGERPTAERVRPSVSATQAGIALLAEFPARPRGLYFRAADLIAAIEAEARQQALTDAIAAVEVIETHEAHAFEPGVEWLCVTSGDPPRSRDCGNDAAHYRLIDRDAVIDTLTRLRDGS